MFDSRIQKLQHSKRRNGNMSTIFIGTRSGVYRLDDSTPHYLGLDGERISAIHALHLGTDAYRIIAGSYESGMFRSDDSGETWHEITNGFSLSCVRWLGTDPLNQSSILAGTEPGRIFRSSDQGDRWTELTGIRQISGYENWYLPYSPRAGAVRNIYSSPGSGVYYASVEVGGLLISEDNGETWRCEFVDVDSDIHFVTGHPERGDLLFAALGYAGIDKSPNDSPVHRGGLARSIDGGRTWSKLFGDYTRGVIVPTSNPSIVVAGPSPNVGRDGRIEVSYDQGDSWEPASEGIHTPMPDMVESFVETPDGRIWAICSGGTLLESRSDVVRWSTVRGVEKLQVESVAFLRD
jgi:photosystem II stability/assembly factor-like uncharacterized protein